MATNFWGIKRKFFYKDITAINGKTKDVKIYIGKKVVRIDEFSIGKKDFINHAGRQYRKYQNDAFVPTRKEKTDIFKGNVENPGEFIFIYVLVGVFLLGAFIFIAIISAPNSEDDLDHKTLSFARYKVEDGDLYLYAGGEEMYYEVLAYSELLTDADGFLSMCEKGEVFDIGYTLYDEAKVPHYGIESIVTADDTVYLTTSAVHEYRWGEVWKIYLLFGAMGLLWFAFVSISIYIGRNPEKFSAKFIRLFFKKEYIHMSKNSRKR